MIDWLFGNGIGTNLGASLIWSAVAGLVGLILWPPTRRWLGRRVLAPFHDHFRRVHDHNEWMARHVAELYRHQTGREPDAHPHFDLTRKENT